MSIPINTPRLIIRNWHTKDLDPFAALCADKEVMQYFPKTLTKKECAAFIKRMQTHFTTHGFCYFALEERSTNTFIGFTGALWQNFESPFTPCVDLGWRLKKDAWGKGYATEAAKAVIHFLLQSKEVVCPDELYAFAPDTNMPSRKVMKKLGMRWCGNFIHPLIANDTRFSHCVAYSIKKNTNS